MTKTFTFENINGDDVDYEFHYEINNQLRQSYIRAYARRPMLNADGNPISGKTVPCSSSERLAIFTFIDEIADIGQALDEAIEADDDFLNEEFKEEAYAEFRDSDSYRGVRDSGIPSEKELL